jgi:hypothetical protein
MDDVCQVCYVLALMVMLVTQYLQMFAITCMHILHNRVGVLPIVEDHTVTVKCRTASIKHPSINQSIDS